MKEYHNYNVPQYIDITNKPSCHSDSPESVSPPTLSLSLMCGVAGAGSFGNSPDSVSEADSDSDSDADSGAESDNKQTTVVDFLESVVPLDTWDASNDSWYSSSSSVARMKNFLCRMNLWCIFRCSNHTSLSKLVIDIAGFFPRMALVAVANAHA